MIRVAQEIARAALPALAELDDAQLRRVVYNRDWRVVLGYYPSAGEAAVLNAAFTLELLLERCDGDTVGQVLEVVDRVRAGMVA